MWALNNRTPYAAERTWIRDKTGAHHWIVAVKASFDIQPGGKVELAEEQDPCLLAPEYFGEPGKSSVRYEADVVPPKPTTDILVEANAYAPRGRPTSSVPVTLEVGNVRKTIIVHGQRVYYKGTDGRVTTSAGVPFVTRPIRYEEAYGGSDLTDPDPRQQRFDSRNPVGKGVSRDPTRLINQPAHTVEYPDGDPAKRGPAGFGPIAGYWSPRREHAGTYDDQWANTKKPLLPDDFDDRFHLAAPEDQRASRHLHGGEIVCLTNVTTTGALVIELPKIFLAFSTRFGRRREEHRSRLGTVILEPESKVRLVWQTSLLVKGPDSDYLDETFITEKRYV